MLQIVDFQSYRFPPGHGTQMTRQFQLVRMCLLDRWIATPSSSRVILMYALCDVMPSAAQSSTMRFASSGPVSSCI
jgi:hypothetical protein